MTARRASGDGGRCATAAALAVLTLVAATAVADDGVPRGTTSGLGRASRAGSHVRALRPHTPPLLPPPGGAAGRGAPGPPPIGAAGPPPLGAAGPPPLGAAGPPPVGAAGPPPLGAAGGAPRVVVHEPPRCEGEGCPDAPPAFDAPDEAPLPDAAAGD